MATPSFRAPPARDATGPRAWAVLVALCVGYVGVYLARKNLAVAIPLLLDGLGLTREQAGAIASTGTIAYALGKVVGGPVVDRLGGRAGFLASLVLVAVFSVLTGAAPSLSWIMVGYAANRGVGAVAWGAMLKLLPGWFIGRVVAMAVAVLSLSYVAGGAAATLLAREVVQRGGSWRSVFVAPGLALLALLPLMWLAVRAGPHAEDDRLAADGATTEAPGIRTLLRSKTMLLGCALSFLVTLLREAFNTWSIDFLTQAGGGHVPLEVAAVQSVGFDLAGVVGIVGMGAAWTALGAKRGLWVVVASLVALAVAIASLPAVGGHPLAASAVLAAVGLLVYGPFSLLGGLLALAAGGARAAATASGLVDGVGYVASALAGATLGRVLDVWGYRVGFGGLSGLALVAAVLASRLRLEDHAPAPEANTSP
jgi:sugar phosphate permease